MASDSPGFIDLSGNERPERATMIVQAWQQKKRSEKKLYLDGPDGTLADFERKLREEGLDEGYRVVQCHLHALQPPPARYNTVMALQPTNRSQSKASGGGSRGSRSGGSGEPKAPRELTTLFWNCPVSFDFLAKVTAPDFTPAQGIKEIIDNAVQSLVFLFQIDQPRLMQHEKPQIVILIDLQRGALRIVDNGGGLNPQQMRAWAHIGISRNRDRVQEMLEAKPDSPLITGLFSALASAFGIGSKGGGASLTCVQNEVRGKLTLYSYQGPDVDGNDNLQRIVFDLQEAQRREKEKDDSPWTRPYNGNLELSSQPELKELMSRPGWGDRITCFEVAGLSPTVLEKLRDRGGAAIFNEFVETWAYSFHSPLYDELVDGCPGFDQLRNPKPLQITASVEVSDGDGAPQVIDLNALAQQKYAKVLRSPSSAQQPSSSMQPQRRSGMRGGLDAGGFYYPIEVSDGDKKGIALLHLRYYPIKALEETLPEGCEPGFDVRRQGRKLTDEKMRLLRFMDPGRGGLSAAGCGGPQKELKMLLEKVGHRVFGDLLLNHSFAVNKNKSLLLITGEESSSGSIKLVKRLLDKPATEWEPLPGGLGVIDALLQWLKQSIMQDEEFRFEWEDGDVESAPAGFSGWVTKVLKLGTKEFKAPRNRHGHAAEEKPLRLCLHKDLKKKFDKKTNAVYAEVHSFRFTEDTIENREDVESRCRAASDGDVLFWAWTDKRSEHLEAMPLKHIAQLNESTGISDKEFEAYVKSHKQALEKTKPKDVVCFTGAHTTIVSKNMTLSLEDACNGKADEHTALWFALRVRNHGNKEMNLTELNGYTMKLTARHQRSDRDPIVVETSEYVSPGVAWMRPALDEPGKWTCSAAIEKDGVVVGNPFSVTLTVKKAARYESFTVDFDDDNNEPQRLGELVPPIVVTALDAAKNDYKLTDLPPQLTFEIVEQPQGQQVRIDESELGRVIENGKVRLEGLKLRGTLAEGKGVGKVKLGIKMGELPVVTGNVKIKCGRPAQLTLLNPNDFAAALDADARLPRLRLRCDDEDGNPASNMTVTLVQEHDGDATSEEPFEHTGKGPSGEGDDAFETKANGEIDIGPKHAAFTVNKEVLQADREVQAKLAFAAKLDAEDEEEDARLEVVVPLAKLEQPELAKLTLFVRGQEGASTPAVSCNDSITIELHGTDEQGNRRRIDLADFDACTKLVLSDLPADVVTATQSPWAQSGDGLEMTMELGGKAGEFDIELDPGHTHYGICDTLRVNLIAGEPDKVVASLASGDATVENGKELVINAQLVDSDGNEVDAAQGVEWTVQPVAEGVAEGSSQGSDGGDGAAAGELLRFHDKRKPKGAAAELRADVLTVRPLHARESFDLLVLARVKRGGVFHTLETEQPLNVTISPGCRVIAGLEAFCVQDDDGGDSKEVDADELPRVTGEPVADSLTVVADGCLPKLAVRAPFEDGSHLKKITTCQLAVKAFSGRALVERKRDGDPVELHIAGQDPTQALLVEGLKAPTSAGQYTLELRLSFGSTKELPQKELLQGAKRYEVTKTIQVIVTAGPPAELTPKMMLEQGGALKVVGNEELPLQGDLAWLIDASKNKLASDAAVTLTLAPYASGSQDEPAMTLALAQPAATLNLANGVLAAPKLQLSGEAPSGRYELKFELQADRAVHGRILLDYENPADRGKREEVLERQKKQLQAKKERLLAEQKEETELAKRQKTCSGAVKEKERVYERIAKEREDVKSNITQKRGRLEALNLDTESAKRLKASYGLGQGDATMASAPSAGSQQPSALGAKVIRPKLAELEQSLTVGVKDGEGSNVRKRKRDFPVEMRNEDDGGHVQLELRRVDALPAGSGASSSQQPFGLYKAVSRSGNEVSAERIGEQELQEDRTGEYLLDALQKESLFETGRVADARISDVIVALRHNTDAALLAPPRVDETMPTKLSLQTGHLRGIAVLAPPPEEEKKALMARIDPGTGLLKVGAEGGAIHPRDVAGASYLINRIVCDDAEARVAWYRALQSAGGYGDAILFGSSSAMYAHSEQAASSAVLIALQDDTGVLDGGSGFAMISHGEYRVLPKAQAAPQAALCKLGPVKEQDEEQVLSGTAEGERVVKFEKVSKELSELEEEEQSKDREEEEAEIEKVRAAAEQQVLDKELNPLREETIKPLREEIKRLEASLKAATGTPGPASAGKKRARSS